MNACRHLTRKGAKPSCAAGRDIEAWVRRCGNPQGWGRMLPCTKNAPEKPLFDCPELDRKTNEEVEAERREMSDSMDRFVKGLSALNKMKAKMIANRLPSAVATCPYCGKKDAMRVSVALGVNNHMRARCSACDMGFIE